MSLPGQDRAPHADLDTIIERLIAANETLDAQLDSVLCPLPTEQVLQLASEVVSRLVPAARQQGAEQLGQKLARVTATTSGWDELRRPSLAQLQASFADRRLMRA